jgi:hypothetical protein
MKMQMWDEDEYEVVIDSRPCSCQGKCDGGCSGSFGVGYRRRDPVAVAKIKADRQRAEEDRILAEADAIRARRGG